MFVRIAVLKTEIPRPETQFLLYIVARPNNMRFCSHLSPRHRRRGASVFITTAEKYQVARRLIKRA